MPILTDAQADLFRDLVIQIAQNPQSVADAEIKAALQSFLDETDPTVTAEVTNVHEEYDPAGASQEILAVGKHNTVYIDRGAAAVTLTVSTATTHAVGDRISLLIYDGGGTGATVTLSTGFNAFHNGLVLGAAELWAYDFVYMGASTGFVCVGDHLLGTP
jgi:hypothetical protein